MFMRTPLRYPGGKSRLTPYFRRVLEKNSLIGGVYAEPFAGGAGVAMNLLSDGDVSEVRINDADRSIYAFWKSITEHNSEFLEIMDQTAIDMEEWYDMKVIQGRKETAGILELGISTFFLNRTNRSGILTAGAIGGQNQNGNYKIGARFNKPVLLKKIKYIGELADRIHVSCKDAIDFMGDMEDISSKNILMYIDPPYYNKGSTLYMNYFEHDDHLKLSNAIRSLDHNWILSYDNTPKIRRIYDDMEPVCFDLRYSSYESRVGKEVFYCSEGLLLPDEVPTLPTPVYDPCICSTPADESDAT